MSILLLKNAKGGRFTDRRREVHHLTANRFPDIGKYRFMQTIYCFSPHAGV